ncbi:MULTISPECIES: hypothetical protein [unclassified Pantoea]|nr:MULTISPECIES: hypothetical protein [unclassified Pantoea]
MSERPDDDVIPLPDDAQPPGGEPPFDDEDETETDYPADDPSKPL